MSEYLGCLHEFQDLIAEAQKDGINWFGEKECWSMDVTGEIIRKVYQRASLKRGSQAAKLARPESNAAVKHKKGRQNVKYNMVSHFIANADGTSTEAKADTHF